MDYRREIDGLRALAVLPVMLFHAGFKAFSGGFVGVDVFFVISGYLITTILINDIESKQFSIATFYERRARRILPALLFVLLCCLPFAWLWLYPTDLAYFSQSLTSVLAFYSNFFFWRRSGYFEVASHETPLLHTWSLAVEEQYYLLFPIFLFLAWRMGKNRVFWTIVILAVTSIALSEWGWRNKATANFYLAPTRAWELFAGSLVAFVTHKRGVEKNNLLALIGLVAIIFAVFAYDGRTPFPSLYALVPVLGAMLFVLFAGKDTFAARLLSTNVLVGIGLISYSAYLWHQPLFAFSRYRYGMDATALLKISIIITALALAFLTWHFVEQPFRKGAYRLLPAVLLSCFMILSFSLLASDGAPSRFADLPSTLLADRDFGQFLESKYEACPFRLSERVRCTSTTIDSTRTTVIVLGDSHSEHLFPGLAETDKSRNYVHIATATAPFVDNLRDENIIQNIGRYRHNVSAVIFSMHYLERFRDLPLGSTYYTEVGSVVEALRPMGIDIYLVGDVPKFPYEPRHCHEDLILRNSQSKCVTVQSQHEMLSHQYQEDLKSVKAKYPFVKVVLLDEVFCDGELCRMKKGGEFMFRDSNHLSPGGSGHAAAKILEALNLGI